MSRRSIFALPLLIVLAAPAAALAHTGHDLGAHHLFGQFAHRIAGLDDVLATAAAALTAAVLLHSALPTLRAWMSALRRRRR
jgi:hypothetical protein